MTLTIDGHQLFWCALAAGVFSMAASLAVQAAVAVARLTEASGGRRPKG